LRQDIEELWQQLQEYADQSAAIAEKDRQITELRQEVEELWQQLAEGATEAGAIAEKDRQIAELRRQTEELRLELQTQAEAIAALPTKNRQIADLQHQIQDLHHQLQQRLDPQRQLTEKDHQIAQLQQQIADLQHPHTPHPTPHTPPTHTDLERQLKTDLGTTVWFCLDEHSQSDLTQAAVQHQELLLRQETDFSAAGDRLCQVLAREIIQPFFQALYGFLSEQNRPLDISGISLEPRKQYAFGLLPALITTQWETLNSNVLNAAEQPPDERLFIAGTPAQLVGAGDRTVMQQFLQGWEHPLATWLLEEAEEAASCIDQSHKLHLRVTQGSPFYQWHYDLLSSLVMGDEELWGILQAVYRGPR